MIRVNNISKSFNGIQVLKDISFQFQKGKTNLIIGKSGSGKTSLIMLMAGLEQPTSGEIIFDQQPISTFNEDELADIRKKKIGIVFQDFKLLSDRTVFKNLEFVLRATNWKSNIKIQERIIDVLKKVELEHLKDKYPNALSGGEKQRISIARAILNEPKLILADEPTGNLDPATSESIMNLLLEINESGSAIIMATHDYNLISKNPKRTIRVEDERLFELSKKT